MVMKRRIMWWTVCIFLILVLGISVLFIFKSIPKSGLLKINGVGITQENVTIHRWPHYAELPLTEVMNSLGMEVSWIDNNVAKVTYKTKKYTLNTSEISLIEDGDSFNLLFPPPGGNRISTVLEKELILDDNTVESAMYLIGIKLWIRIDHKEQVVYITHDSVS